jgi:hypothetical protein
MAEMGPGLRRYDEIGDIAKLRIETLERHFFRVGLIGGHPVKPRDDELGRQCAGAGSTHWIEGALDPAPRLGSVDAAGGVVG